MCMKLMHQATRHTRFQGDKRLALCSLAHSADEDGLYWPPTWNVQSAELQRDSIFTIIHALEQAGEIVVMGSGPTTLLWIAIAFTPRELKEIAMRRLNMDDKEATAFVSEIVARQLH